MFWTILLLKVCSSITWLPRRKAGSQAQPHNYRIRICVLRSSPDDLAEQETEKHCLGIDGNLQTDQSFSALTSESPAGFVSVKIPGSFPEAHSTKLGWGHVALKKFTCLPLLVKMKYSTMLVNQLIFFLRVSAKGSKIHQNQVHQRMYHAVTQGARKDGQEGSWAHPLLSH